MQVKNPLFFDLLCDYPLPPVCARIAEGKTVKSRVFDVAIPIRKKNKKILLTLSG